MKVGERLDSANCDGSFEVVFVCTGNRARSVLAEALFRRHAAGIETSVSSVGTLDLGLAPALPACIEAGRQLGVDLTRHRARTLLDVNLGSADLVVGFESAHIAAAVVEGHASAGRTFLLGDLLALIELPVEDLDSCVRARAVVAEADSRRARYRISPLAVEIADPLGRSARYLQTMADQIDDLIRRLVAGLFGIDVPPRKSMRAPRRAKGRR